VIQKKIHFGGILLKQHTAIAGMTFLLLLFMTASPVLAVSETTAPPKTGGNIYFETEPPGASILLDNTNIGTTPFTYFSEKSGTLQVLVQKKYYEDYTGTVTINGGERVVFYARLNPLPNVIPGDATPAIPVTTSVVREKSTMKPLPTAWPATTTPESPMDPAVVLGALAIGTAVCAVLRR
jgi:hypothetical protein